MSPGRPLAKNVRRLRRARGLSVVELARAAQIGRATLTQLEAGSGNPTLETLYSLAGVLGCPLAELIAERVSPNDIRVVRTGQGEEASGSAVQAHLLFRGQAPGLSLEIYAIRVGAGRTQTSHAHAAGTREHVHVHNGELIVGPVDADVALRCGDYADYRADIEHSYRGGDGEDAVATLVIVTPTTWSG